MGSAKAGVGEGMEGVGRLIVLSQCVGRRRCGAWDGRGVAWAGGRGGAGVRGRLGMGIEVTGMVKLGERRANISVGGGMEGMGLLVPS